MTPAAALTAYKQRLRRRRLLGRAFLKRRQLSTITDRTKRISPGDLLAFATVRNEITRLPYWLDHHRKLGISHFLIVENDSDDGTREMLADQPDVSLWTTTYSYKMSRFGMDWLTWLAIRYGHGHWCLTLDADEIWLHPHHETRDLHALTQELDRRDQPAMGALMLELYPKGHLGDAPHTPGTDPTQVIPWFDASNYVWLRQSGLKNLWIQGGPRARAFFSDGPRRAPTLSKLPLVKWNRRYAYASSTHSLLPPRMNLLFDGMAGRYMTGILLHTKFLPEIVEKSAIEKQRGEHFENSSLHGRYYDALVENPELWTERSTRFTGWQQLEGLGLMTRAGWN